jgi:hypothetical protein
LKQFTLLQAAICAVIFLITLTPAAMVFPVLIGVLIPFRQYGLLRLFPLATVELLDPPPRPETLREDSSDGEDHVIEIVASDSGNYGRDRERDRERGSQGEGKSEEGSLTPPASDSGDEGDASATIRGGDALDRI